MSSQCADDFKGYGTDSNFMLDGLYAQVDPDPGTLVEDPDPNATGTVYLLRNGRVLRRVLPYGANVTVGIALRVWFPQLPSSAQLPMLCSWLPDTGNFNDTNLSLQVTATGVIRAYRGGDPVSATLLGQSTLPALAANSWNRIETRCLGSDTLGEVEVRVNGVPVPGLDLSALDTNGVTAQFILSDRDRLGAGGIGTITPGIYVKDLYVWDGSGTHANDFSGNAQVFGSTTDSDVAFPWVPSTGLTGWNLLDNSPPLDATQYISAGDPPPAAAIFGLTNLPADTTSVRTVITEVRARKVDGGDGMFQVGMVSGASTGLGQDRPLTTAFTYYDDVFDVSPDSGTSWTPSEFDAANIQMDRTL